MPGDKSRTFSSRERDALNQPTEHGDPTHQSHRGTFDEREEYFLPFHKSSSASDSSIQQAGTSIRAGEDNREESRSNQLVQSAEESSEFGAWHYNTGKSSYHDTNEEIKRTADIKTAKIKENVKLTLSKMHELNQEYNHEKISKEVLNDKWTLCTKDVKHVDHYDRGESIALSTDASATFMYDSQIFLRECQKYNETRKRWEDKHSGDLTSYASQDNPDHLNFPVNSDILKTVTGWLFATQARQSRAAGFASVAYEYMRQIIPSIEPWPGGIISYSSPPGQHTFLTTATEKVEEAIKQMK